MPCDIAANTTDQILTRQHRNYSKTEYGILGCDSPKLLAVAVRNCEGNVIGVLSATLLPDIAENDENSGGSNGGNGGGSNDELVFTNEDCLIMHLMAQYTAGNIEKIAAKKVLSSASFNISKCENTLRQVAKKGGGGGGGGGVIGLKENNNHYY